MKVFKKFPKNQTCVICGKGGMGESVLISVEGTEERGICQAKVAHFTCAVLGSGYCITRIKKVS